MNIQELVQMHNNLVQEIYTNDYFINTYERAVETYELDKSSSEQICGFWNHFWYMLPDNPSIRREPFYQVCDMAEGKYLGR